LKKESERCTAAELARRWGVSRTMVGRYRKKGLRAGEDGLYSFPEADKWRRDTVTPVRSGSYKQRLRDSEATETAKAKAETWTFSDGYFTARHDLREQMPIMIAGEHPPATLKALIGLFAEIDARLGHIQWLETGRNPELPNVDWSLFQSSAVRERAIAMFGATEERFAGYRQSITAAKERTK
jgi:hypothetical protein